MLGQTGSEGSTGLRSLAISLCCEHRRRRLWKRKKVRHSMRTAAITRCQLDWRFPEDHPWFCGLGWLFFLLVSFVFCFFFFSISLFFFGTRLLTLRNLQYVATRLLSNQPRFWYLAWWPRSQSCFLVHHAVSWSCRLDLFCKPRLSECCLLVAGTWEGYVRCDIQ